MRIDLAFTLFLANPESYGGGALVIEDACGEQEVKLPAGELFLYPATMLHRVAPVTSGVRLAAVGWVRSFVRDAGRREVLFDLENAVRSVHASEGKSFLFDTLVRTRTNLLRMWATTDPALPYSRAVASHGNSSTSSKTRTCRQMNGPKDL